MRGRVVLLAAVLFLGACGFTPEGDFVREAVKSYGAKAFDEGLGNAEWFICEAASVGSVRRRYGKSGVVDAYRELCGVAGARLLQEPEK